MVPASKVSVPPTVVMRTRSRVPERANVPPETRVDVADVEPLNAPDATHVFPVIKVKIKEPLTAIVAEFARIPNPAVKAVEDTTVSKSELVPTYPEDVKDPEPI